MKLLYLANIRMPTEKAHGLQIMQMCEAFAACGADVELLTARRTNTREMSTIADPFAYYGVRRDFQLGRVACIDLFSAGPRLARLAFAVQSISYTLVLVLKMVFRRADVYYTRDLFTIAALSLIKPRRKLGYEVHQRSTSGVGRRLQDWCLRRAGTVITVTGRLADEVREVGARHVVVAHDGYRAERFAGLPDRTTARKTLGLPTEEFIVGYSGRLHTMSLSKGVDSLIDAIGTLAGRRIALCLVGGPDDIAHQLRERWIQLGLPAELFLYPGHVAPGTVPTYLASFDVCAMPSPKSDFFSYYSSPLKLFEYMAAGGAILGSNLPAMTEVVHDGETALLTEPGDVAELASALARLYDEPDLRVRLGAAAQREAVHYSWQARAERILKVLGEAA